MYSSITMSSARGAVVVEPMFADDVPGAAALARTRRRARTPSIARIPRGFRGDLGETIAASDGAVIIGLGKRADLKLQSLRSAGAKLVRALERMGVGAARLDIASAIPRRVAPRDAAGQAVGEGMAVGNWRFDKFDGAASTRPQR